MSKRHQIDSIFREGLEHSEVIPPLRAWNEIQKELPLPIPFYRKPSNWFGGVGILILLGIFSWYIINAPLKQELSSVPPPSSELAVTQKQLSGKAMFTTKQTIPSTSISDSKNTPTSIDVIKKTISPIPILSREKPISPTQSSSKLTDDSNNPTNESLSDVSKSINTLLVPTSFVLDTPEIIQNKNSTISKVDKLNDADNTDVSNPSPKKIETQKIAQSLVERLVQTLPLMSKNTPEKTVAKVFVPTPSVAPIVAKKEPSKTINSTKEKFVKPEQVVNKPIQKTNVVSSKIAPTLPEETEHLETKIIVAVEDLSVKTSPSKTADETASLNILEAKEIEEKLLDKSLTTSSKIVQNMPINLEKDAPITSGLHFGALGQFNNIWIFNPDLFSSNSKENLVHQLDFGGAYGFSLGYDFSKNFGVQLDWILASDQGQRLNRYTPTTINKSAEKENINIRLNYATFPVLFKYRLHRIFRLTKKPMTLNYLAGFEYGHLKSISVPSGNEKLQRDLQQRNSWGFVVGMDYDIYLNKNYFLTFGARSTISTSSTGKIVLPSPNTTNRVLVGLRLGLNYRFSD